MKPHIIGLILICVAFFAGRHFSPKTVEIKEVENIVIKKEEKKDENRNITVETKETVLPDGTKVTHTISHDQSQTRTDTKTSETSEKERTSKSSSEQAQWSVGLYTDKAHLLGTIDRRILGGLFIGVYGHSELSRPMPPEVGIGLRLEF